MPVFQCDKHAVHWVLGSVSSNSHNSMSGLKRWNEWFRRRSFWKTWRHGWFLIFNVGSLGIRKSLSAPFTFFASWLTSWYVTIINGSIRFLMKYFISNVERFAFMSRTCLWTVWHIHHFMRDSRSPRSLLCLFNIDILSVFRWTCLDYICHMNGFPVTSRTVRSEELLKKTSSGWERDVFHSSCISIMSCVTSGRPDLPRTGFRVG